jgi:hypothetical protein
MARLNERMIVADSKDDPRRPRLFRPRRNSYRLVELSFFGHLHTGHLAAFPVDPWPPALLVRDHSILTQFFITRIDHHLRILALEFAPSEASQLSVQLLVDLTDRTRAKLCLQSSSLVAFTLPVRLFFTPHY